MNLRRLNPSLRDAACQLLLATSLFATLAHADTASPYDWQPCPSALAKEGAAPNPRAQQWDLTLSPWTHHWNYNPEHHHVLLGAVDRYLPGQRFCGLALFNNSFGQPSAYAYVGQRWDGVLHNPRLFFKLSGGFIYGYKDKYKDKIPFNDYGIAPAVIPALGYQLGEGNSVQLMVLGNAGILFAFGHTF